MEPRYYRKRHKIIVPSVLQVSVAINLILAISLLYVLFASSNRKSITETRIVWHGGHPAEDKAGSCWCGEDKYCMCTPNLAIDLIITSGGPNRRKTDIVESFWLVRRKDTNELATMGGFVDLHETVEDAIKRELMEEMALSLGETQTLVGVYSDPRRDNRRRTASVVFAVHFPGEIRPRAGDDAKEVVKVAIDEVENHHYFADHMTILLDYRSTLRGEDLEQQRVGDNFAGGVIRSTCKLSK